MKQEEQEHSVKNEDEIVVTESGIRINMTYHTLSEEQMEYIRDIDTMNPPDALIIY